MRLRSRRFYWAFNYLMLRQRFPRYEHGVTEVLGLLFVGLHWQHSANSEQFYQVGRDAEHVVNHICRNVC